MCPPPRPLVQGRGTGGQRGRTWGIIYDVLIAVGEGAGRGCSGQILDGQGWGNQWWISDFQKSNIKIK